MLFKNDFGNVQFVDIFYLTSYGMASQGKGGSKDQSKLLKFDK